MIPVLLLLLLGAAPVDSAREQARLALSSGKPAVALAIVAPLAMRVPDDVELQFLYARALRLTGNFAEAEKATQWLLDLRPDYLGGLHEAALLREQFGDLFGATDLLSTVYRATPTSKPGDRAAILEDLARIFDKQQQPAQATQMRTEATRLKGIANANQTPAPDRR
jgi:tetratricopeptide (TPR) repeat protein